MPQERRRSGPKYRIPGLVAMFLASPDAPADRRPADLRSISRHIFIRAKRTRSMDFGARSHTNGTLAKPLRPLVSGARLRTSSARDFPITRGISGSRVLERDGRQRPCNLEPGRLTGPVWIAGFKASPRLQIAAYLPSHLNLLKRSCLRLASSPSHRAAGARSYYFERHLVFGLPDRTCPQQHGGTPVSVTFPNVPPRWRWIPN